MDFISKQWNKLFHPATSRCLLCEQVIERHSTLQDANSYITVQLNYYVEHMLCATCVAKISWITTVQCQRCGRTYVCSDCTYKALSQLRKNRSSVSYNDNMKEWLKQYKFIGNQGLYELFGSMLVPVFHSISLGLIIDLKLFEHWKASQLSIERYVARYKLWDYIVAVPSSEARLRERGFNQAEQLATYISSYYDVPCVNLLVREQDGEKLSFQGKWQRAQSAANRYTLHHENWYKLMREHNLKQRQRKSSMERQRNTLHILLLDDVYTTGTTLEECAKALKQGSDQVSVYSMTWARA